MQSSSQNFSLFKENSSRHLITRPLLFGQLSNAKDGHSPIPSQHAERFQNAKASDLLPFLASASVHEKPLCSGVRRLPTHRAPGKLLALLAVAANHMATRDQRHGRTVLLANGANDLGTFRHALLRTAGCCIIRLPTGSQVQELPLEHPARPCAP